MTWIIAWMTALFGGDESQIRSVCVSQMNSPAGVRFFADASPYPSFGPSTGRILRMRIAAEASRRQLSVARTQKVCGEMISERLVRNFDVAMASTR